MDRYCSWNIDTYKNLYNIVSSNSFFNLDLLKCISGEIEKMLREKDKVLKSSKLMYDMFYRIHDFKHILLSLVESNIINIDLDNIELYYTFDKSCNTKYSIIQYLIRVHEMIINAYTVSCIADINFDRDIAILESRINVVLFDLDNNPNDVTNKYLENLIEVPAMNLSRKLSIIFK